MFCLCAYHRQRVRGFCFSNGFSKIRSVDPSGFCWLSWSSEFLQTLIGVPFSGAMICLADRSCWCLLLCIYDFPVATSTSSCVSKNLLRQGRGPEVASSYAHGTPLVDAGASRLRHPKALVVFLGMGVFVRSCKS